MSHRNRIFHQSERAVSKIDFVAIAIRIEESNQRHVGILYQEHKSSETSLLHLAWHHRLRNEMPGGDDLWVAPNIPKRRLRQVATRCRQIWRSNENNGIPFGFSHPSDCFDSESGEFLLGPTRHGLTCASFVLGVFHFSGLLLIQYETWPTGRPGDIEWQMHVINLLEQSKPPASHEHIEAVRKEIGNVRYRPEEVAGSALVSPLPADCKSAAIQSKEILRRLNST